jgi:hypothetical protein
MSLGLAVALAGCIREKEVCYSGLLMHYHYDLNPRNENLFGDEVGRLAILVYDADGRFHRMFVVDDPALLTNDNLIHLDVPDGEWTVVTWGGDMRSFEMGLLDSEGEVHPHDYTNGAGSTLAEHRVWIRDYTLEADGSKLVTGELSNLYYGYAEGATARRSPMPAPHTEVQMTRNTNTLTVRLTDLPPEAGRRNMTRAHDDNITVHADMVNGRCRADNEICLNARNIHYEQRHSISSEATSMQVDLNVMRLFAHDETSTITVSGDFLEHHGYPGAEISIDVVPTILQHPDYNTQEDLDRENHYEFELDFEADGSISVIVNGWKIKDIIVSPL